MTATNMLSTIACLAILLPDWNSLDSVRRVHSRCEFSSIVFFGLLALAEAIAHLTKDEKRKLLVDTIGIAFFVIAVISEGVGYPYGQRNDTLSEQAIGSLDTLSKEAERNASRAVSDSGIAIAQAKIANTSAGAAALTASTAKTEADFASHVAGEVSKESDSIKRDFASTRDEIRRLGPRYGLFVGAIRDQFKATTKPFVGQKLVIATRSNAGVEERQLSLLLYATLYSPVRPSWDVKRDDTASFLSPEIMLGISKGKATESTRQAAQALSRGLGAVGITDINGGNPLRIEDFPELPPDTIELMIGEHIPIIKRALDGSSK